MRFYLYPHQKYKYLEIKQIDEEFFLKTNITENFLKQEFFSR